MNQLNMMQKFTELLIPTLVAIVLLSGCKGGVEPKAAADVVPDRAHSRSTAATSTPRLAIGAQQGGARQGVNLSLKNVVSTFAGKAGTAGAADGIAIRAKFDAPKGITTDGLNLYVADLNNHTIRKIEIESGMAFTVAGMAGKKGSADGKAAVARFNRPYGITTDGNNLYVTDSNNHSVRQIDIDSGVVTTLAGGVGEVGYVDGTGKQARFFIPEGITTDGINLYVADTHNHSVRKISLENAVVTTLAGLSGATGFIDGVGARARFSYPKGITTDGRSLYVADFGNHSLRKITLASGAVTTLIVNVKPDDTSSKTGELARFNYPSGIATDGRNLYVADTFNRTIRKVVIASGAVTTIAGKSEIDGDLDATGSEARFNDPVAITSDGSNLFVTDSGNNTIRKIR